MFISLGGDLNSRRFILLGATIMIFGVAIGAFGAHGLRPYFERFPELAETYNTAVQYHLIHGLAVFIAAWVDKNSLGAWPKLAGYLFIVGVLFFSGSLYLLVITRQSWLGAITPVGGAAFLGGWATLLLAAWQDPSASNQNETRVT